MQQAAAKERERRILQLTINEITQIQGDVNLYKGVGKMYVTSDQVDPIHSLYGVSRFLNVPRTSMEEELKNQEKELSDDITSLNKKVRLLI